MKLGTRRWGRVAGRPSTIVCVAAVVAAAIWWQFPVLADHGGRTDVLIIADGFLTGNAQPVTYRIHEDGRSLVWGPAVGDWCSLPTVVTAEVARVHPTTVVLSIGAKGQCDGDVFQRAVEAAGARTVVVVRQPGASGVERDGAGARTVDPTRLIGGSLVLTSLPCQWWDRCEADGKVLVRDAHGALTAAGTDRVARMLVAELP